ncbi:MAG: amidohydrolase family protein, partial [Ilumatobacteraceae bacterium]
MPADLIVANGDVVTMNPNRDVLAGGAVAVAGTRIVDVGATSALRQSHPEAAILDATDCVVTPGMINAHQHMGGGPLARSCIPDDLVPGTSIFFWSIPRHAAETADDEELAGLLSTVESVRNGITTMIEAGTMSYPDRLGNAMRTVGVRGTVGIWGWDVESGPLTGPYDEVLDRQRQTLDAFPPGEQVTAWVTLVGHSLASDELLVGAADLARARGVGMTMHMSPTSSDGEVYLKRHGRRPMVHLDQLGV